jgi:hypothetical protein
VLEPHGNRLALGRVDAEVVDVVPTDLRVDLLTAAQSCCLLDAAVRLVRVVDALDGNLALPQREGPQRTVDDLATPGQPQQA